MKLLISHFYNEEYLLPFWLKHHREIFDHGILIDYHSTDRSVEICKELVPDWEIVTSENDSFAAIMCDFEVMQHEKRYPDAWKLVLNTTEFLVGNHLKSVLKWMEKNDYIAGVIPAAIMVDVEPDVELLPDIPLVKQKFYGFWENNFPHEELKLWWKPRVMRARTIHNYTIGAYSPGRHSSNLPKHKTAKLSPGDVAIYWYSYSPWSESFKKRKSQIKTQIDIKDKKFNFGKEHLAENSELEGRREFLLKYTHDMNEKSALILMR
jgi:hypothetical protein